MSLDPEQQYKLKYEIEGLKRENAELRKKIEEFDSKLYEPDNGLYRRVTATSENSEENRKLVTALEKKTNNKIESFDERMKALETTNNALIEIAGEKLDILRLVIESRKKNDKIWWIFLSGVLAGAVKMLWDIVEHLL